MAVLEIKVKTSYLILMTIAVSNRYEFDMNMNMTVIDSRAEHRVKLMEAAIEWRTIILIAITISIFILLRLEKDCHSYEVTHTVTSTAQYNTHRCSTRIKTKQNSKICCKQRIGCEH